MSPKKRARRLSDLLEQAYHGNRGELIKKSRLTRGRISQMLIDGFGERAARELETQLSLPDGYFESDQLAPRPPAPLARAREPNHETPPGAVKDEEVDDLHAKAAQLKSAWLTLTQKDRNRIYREVIALSLQSRDPAPDPSGSPASPAGNNTNKQGTQ